MLDGHPEELNKDMTTPLCNLSHTSTCSSHDAIFTYTDKDINLISDELGILWETSKTIPFDTVVPYLGFVWNLNACTVPVPVEKKLEHLNMIKEWEKKPMHTLAEVQKLYGKLLHASVVVTAKCAYLINLEAMLLGFNNSPFVPHTPPRILLVTSNGGQNISNAQPLQKHLWPSIS